MENPKEGNLRERIERVRERVERALIRSGRKGGVKIIAVTKTVPINLICEAFEFGLRDFGENYVQEALPKIQSLNSASWHFIGTLQSNKAKFIPKNFQYIHTIQKKEIADKLNKKCEEKGVRLKALVEVNIAREKTKGGVLPEDVKKLVEEIMMMKNIELKGLMCLPPQPKRAEDSRIWFVKMRGLRERLLSEGIEEKYLEELSMGTTDDFEVAIEEGSTMIRVGRAIFGERRAK